ncbi:MAG: NAD-dependent malic enzyme [Cyanothece sp. SIO2G6]|nr:NAD-dependent malic enzyme [Cyanothece sp. SIO2G6]
MVHLTPNPSFSLTIRCQIPNHTGMLASITQAITTTGGNISHIDLVEYDRHIIVRDITIDAFSADHAETIATAVKALEAITVLSVTDRTFEMHQGGKISIQCKQALTHPTDLAMAYTPGVGRVCSAIAAAPERVYELTIKSNIVAVVTDGSAVLGLGNLGPEAALPVMEGKAMLFKEFGGVDAFPICLATQNVEEIVTAVKQLAPVFGGINLEDIGAPRCFEIEARLQQELNIPVFHDDQHGTAVVSLAALYNSLKLVKKTLEQVRIVINGAGAAGLAITQLLKHAGATEIILCDSKGILSRDRPDLSAKKQQFSCDESGTLADALKNADVFLGVSAPGVLTPPMVKAMATNPIVFAMANPIPEIQPELVVNDVAVMATGRSDYPNQINNVLAFPGIFRGALDCRATGMTVNMYIGAAMAIAALVDSDDLGPEHIIPSAFDHRVAPAVAAAVRKAAQQDGVAGI